MCIKRIFHVSLVVLAVFSSCERKSEIDFDYDSIPLSYEMEGVIVIDSMMSPQSIESYKTLLISIESAGKFKLKVYNPKSGLEIQSFIRGGRGINEMLQPWTLSVQNDTCWVFDLMLNKIIGLHKSENDTLTFAREFSLEDRRNTMILAEGDGDFVGIGFSDSLKLFSVYDSYGQLIRTFGRYPDNITRESPDIKENALFYSTVYKSRIGISSKCKRIAAAYTRFNMIDIYDFEGRLLKRLYGPEKVDIKVERISPNPGTVLFDAKPKYLAYRQVKVSEKEIWASHSGKILTRENYTQTIPRKIFCFSWNGEIIRELNFDILINDFFVDWESKKLYCLSEKDLLPCVYLFSLDHIL
jgi:TolB-like 6-blade propeller-like